MKTEQKQEAASVIMQQFIKNITAKQDEQDKLIKQLFKKNEQVEKTLTLNIELFNQLKSLVDESMKYLDMNTKTNKTIKNTLGFKVK